MLDIIYNGLGVAIVVLAVIYLILITVLMVKHAYDNVASIKVRIVFTSILFALFIFKMIPAVMLGKSIGNEIFCAILWAICTVLGILCLKGAKTDSPNVEADMFTDSEFAYNKDVIDVDCTEVQDIDDER